MKRRWIFWLLVIIFLWVVISRFSDITKIAETLMQGQWQWVVAAILFMIVYFTTYTGIYHSAFQTVGIQSRLVELIPLTFISIFMNVAAPIGGASGMAVFVDDASRRGQSAAKATVGTLLVMVADFSAFLVVLVTGMIYLFTHHNLKYYESLTAALLLLVIGGLTSFLLLGLWRPLWLRRILSWAQRFANWMARIFNRPAFLEDSWVENNTAEFTEAAIAIAARPALLMQTIGIAFVAHLINLSMLYSLFLAFHQKVHFGMLVAGYAMAILFWIIAVTPQGIGVVEGMMTLVFASLGVPLANATIISLAFRGLTFWIPLAIGFILLRRLKYFGAKEETTSELWGVRLVAILTAVMGIIDVLSGLTPTLHTRMVMLEQYSPFGVSIGGHLTSVLAGFALLILANGLWRRKRLAWVLTVTILILTVPVHLFKGLDYEEAILAAVLAAWLIYLRPYFHAQSDPPSVRQGLLALLAALVFTLLYGVLGFYLLNRHFIVAGQQAGFSILGAARQTVVMFTQFYNPGVVPTGRFGRYFVSSIYIVGAVTIGYALIMLIRPVLVRRGPTQEERYKAQEIIEAYGRSSIARMLLFNDKLYYFSPGGSVIGYAVEGRIALVLGDPIGPTEETLSTIAGFKELCERNDWEAAYAQVLPDNLEAYHELGYHEVCIGHEAIIDLTTFSIAGGDKKNIRTGVNKMNKLGYRAEVRQPPHPAELMQELHQISDEWLTSMHGTEKHFSLGWFDKAYLNSTPLIVIHNPEGFIEAFANIIPEYQVNEISIDLMRHRKQAEKGQMDFLFVNLIEWARAEGYATFNMGLSGLSGIGEHPTDPTFERALHYVYEHINQFYNFKGLHEFKAKYDPSWSPRYLIYPSAASLPAVAIAMMRADAGSDILKRNLKHPK
ncbi:MAG: flippase-like domain-containing protein [Anaerolineae bacterium]|nr:flippase-like domain-containing protein [Anaerolineae bacterium]